MIQILKQSLFLSLCLASGSGSLGSIQIHFPYSVLKVFSWSNVKSNNTLILEKNSLHRQEFVVEEFLGHLFNNSYSYSSVKVMFASLCSIEYSINEYVIDTLVSCVFRFYKPSLKTLIRPISVSSSICLVLPL